jgi:hypothetical protein
MMASKKAAKKARKAINYEKLAQMWAADKTYEEMGKALGMKGNEENDPYKPVRAAISNMLNGKATAWKDGNGQVKTLKPRKGMKAIGVGKKVKGKAKKAVKKASKKTKPVTENKPDGKTLAAGSNE